MKIKKMYCLECILLLLSYIDCRQYKKDADLLDTNLDICPASRHELFIYIRALTPYFSHLRMELTGPISNLNHQSNYLCMHNWTPVT